MTVPIPEIRTHAGYTTLRAPYHPALPARAEALSGEHGPIDWIWTFPDAVEEQVRGLAREVFGTDGTDAPTVDVRFSIAAFGDLVTRGGRPALWLFGRRVVRRRRWTVKVEFGPGVLVVEGGFPARGGSADAVFLAPHPGTRLEVRDVPVGHPHLTEYADRIERVAEPPIGVAALRHERARLLDRVGWINELLGE